MKFSDLGAALAEIQQAVVNSDAPESQKLSLVADIDTIQTQLVKDKPNHKIIAAAWEAVQGAGTIDGCLEFVQKAAKFIGSFLSS